MKSTESLAIPRKSFSMVRILSQIHPSLMRKSGARVIRRLKMDKQSSAEHVEHPKKSLDNPGISDGSVFKMALLQRITGSFGDPLTAAIGKMVGLGGLGGLAGWA
ncbi:uncharacterized protein K444DRAFT_628897 [Hyaloscypha bicolor E]|uniref:Uncharacterized protein n=1 Tax=Hyaloscypha bicolor E TaxID=1095630 RepID=A0A2J6TD02_9HELO|nr:uncharacterized protein K444DRAFT_628897 [Hyaloscypha bicolor E]PMD60862.1 hypothetical protein K444DRAFT_628897 [Hyaloscypha bicolor E]